MKLKVPRDIRSSTSIEPTGNSTKDIVRSSTASLSSVTVNVYTDGCPVLTLYLSGPVISGGKFTANKGETIVSVFSLAVSSV